MFNIGFSELLLVLLVAFVVVGPRDLPKIARTLGRGTRKLKAFLKEFQQETGLDEAVDEWKKTSRDLQQTLRKSDPTADLKQAKSDVESALQSTQKAVADAWNKPSKE